MIPAPFTLRPGIPSDLEAIFALDRATETAPHWPRTSYAAILATSESESAQQRYLVVAEIPSADLDQPPRLAGFAVALINRTARPIAAELEDIIVSEDLRRNGIGRALCNGAIAWSRSQQASAITLEVRSASLGAIALYITIGFRHAGRRPRYYSDPEDDALLMQLDLGS